VVLIETVVPIPTDASLPSLSLNTTSPEEPWCILTVVAVPIIISSIPVIFLSFGSRVIDPVPIVKIPVTLASPFTTKSSL
jgi:hypothetical protein